ncbi:hypothetical protein [Streptomyces sp. NPDC085540]|uniref:hypothetical protein n=1 Tax=Streptomyces sp. NPDC085540 TaxID=3365730 RepID=UPI0037CF3F70
MPRPVPHRSAARLRVTRAWNSPRAPHATDRRTHQLSLTELGHARYEDALPAVQRREAEREAGLTPEQCEAAFVWMSAMSNARQEVRRN